ncbi:unnamed protein product [Closterium sp. NIES-54]
MPALHWAVSLQHEVLANQNVATMWCWRAARVPAPLAALASTDAPIPSNPISLAVGNRTHRERRGTSSCLTEHISPVRRDPRRMLRDGRRPRGNFRRRRRPATTRRRVVFRANGDDQRLPRRQHGPRLKGHLRRGWRAERHAARRHDPRMTHAPVVHPPAPFTPYSIHSLSPRVVSPPTVLIFPSLSLPHPACQSGSSPKPCPCSFNVYVSQAEVKLGCVLRQSTISYWCPS